MAEPRPSSDILYGLDDRPPLGRAVVLGLLLDNLIPGTPEKRGLKVRPSTLVSEADDIDIVPDPQADRS